MKLTLSTGKVVELNEVETNEVYTHLVTNHNGSLAPSVANDKREKQKQVPNVGAAFDSFNKQQGKISPRGLPVAMEG